VQTIKVMHIISSLKRGGAETLLCDLVAQLSAKNMQQVVVFIHSGPMLEPLRALGIPIYHLQGVVCLFDPAFFVRLYRIIKREKPDLIHSSLWAANVAARIMGKITGVPVICALHNNNDQNGTVRNIIDALSLWLADEIISVSDGIVRTMHTYRFLPAGRVKIIKNGIDPAIIRARAQEFSMTREQLGLSKNDFVIGSVGRFVPLKNYPFLLTVFARISRDFPAARLMLVGGGPQEKELRAYANKLNISRHVRFIVDQKAYGYYPLFDCFVQSSAKEGISIALLEAMSCGCPCVVTNEEPFHDVIENGKNGYIVPANNENELYHVIKMLIEKPGIGKQCATWAQDRIENDFALTHMANKYANLYYSLARKKQ
jgi:glycosyltransferase involved in cell wall biosynthesis